MQMVGSPKGQVQRLTRPSQNSDPWGRYYTSQQLSSSLIENIEVRKPKLLLELGSGSGSLCWAAANRWNNAQLITVDVDREAPKRPDRPVDGAGPKHRHFVHDALDEAISEKIGLPLGSVDVAVCNPPYIRPKWRADFGKILEDAGLNGALASKYDAGADLLFLAQNLRLLRRNGKLGLILPDGLVTAERFAGVRRALLRQHLIEQVVQLPRSVFKGTEAQTYLAVLSKLAGETDVVALSQMSSTGEMSEPVVVPQELATKRLDYAFHAGPRVESRLGHPLPIQVGAATTEIIRGSICSSSIGDFPVPVFHLGDFREPSVRQELRIVPRRFTLSRRATAEVVGTARLALPGDILLARVGRSLERQLALVVHGPCVISDCIFALRTTDQHRERLYRFFDSDSGRSALAASAHGVAARFLSKANLSEIQF